MNYIKKNFLTITLSILLSLVFLMPVLSLAQDDIGPDGGGAILPGAKATPLANGQIVNPLSGSTTLDVLIANILQNALKIGIPLIALAIIYCGFLFVSAQGKPEELTKARDALIYTLIGAAILLGSYALALLIKNTVVSLG